MNPFPAQPRPQGLLFVQNRHFERGEGGCSLRLRYTDFASGPWINGLERETRDQGQTFPYRGRISAWLGLLEGHQFGEREVVR